MCKRLFVTGNGSGLGLVFSGVALAKGWLVYGDRAGGGSDASV